MRVSLPPNDVYNQELLRQTHPEDWQNPTPQGRYNLVVIGGGTAGLTAAGACAAVGGRVALIEKHFTGGDCLVTGCVPSKALIRSARAVYAINTAQDFGVKVPSVAEVDFDAVMERMRRLRARISPADSVQKLKDSGVDVYLGEARFISPEAIEVDGTVLTFSRALIATGGRPWIPDIPGLKDADPLTSETIFQLTELPKRLAVLGAGPIGCELAQTFRRLGAEVCLIQKASHILMREDQDAASLVQQQFAQEGVQLILNAELKAVVVEGEAKQLKIQTPQGLQQLTCDEVLVATGRKPNIDNLALDKAGVSISNRGLEVDAYLKTSNPRIFAAGDVVSHFQFTHTANAFGRMAFMNALFWGRKKTETAVVPWCTYTDPEVAHVGLYEDQAKQQGYQVDTITVSFKEMDRAILDQEDTGFVRVHLKAGSDHILGATLVSAHAGELLSYITLLMSLGKGLSALSEFIYPYPTQTEVLRKLANTYQQRKLKPWVVQVLRRILAYKR